MRIEHEGAVVSGGYEYAVQRLSDLRYISEFACADGGSRRPVQADEPRVPDWTYNPGFAMTASTVDPNHLGERGVTVQQRFRGYGVFRDDIDECEFEAWSEERAWELSLRLLEPGYRLMRIPFVAREDLIDPDEPGERDFGTREQYEAYMREHPSRFWIDDNTLNYPAMRDALFGRNAAIAADDEQVPSAAPWSACSASTLTARMIQPMGLFVERKYQFADNFDSQGECVRTFLPELYRDPDKPVSSWNGTKQEAAR